MTARKAAHRYSAMGKRAAAGFATALLHHCVGHDPPGARGPDRDAWLLMAHMRMFHAGAWTQSA